MTLKIPISAEFDSAGTEKSLQELVKRVNQLGQAVAQANRLKFNPVDKASLGDLNKLNEQYQQMLKKWPALSQRVQATNQQGLHFAQVELGRMWSDPRTRGRSMLNAFNNASAGTVFDGRFDGGAAGGGGSHYPGREIVDAGLSPLPGGRAISRGIGATIRGGLLAGASTMIGGLAAWGVGKAVGGVVDKMGVSENEDTGYDTLKRQLGDVNVSFGVLKRSLRKAADGLDISYQESQSLAKTFAHVSGMYGGTSDRALGKEVEIGGGLARSFGLDLSSGVGFMAQMRQSKVTSDEASSKRMALLIGETIAKSGAFSRADELLQVVSQFTAQQTRLSMNSANVSGYSGMLAGAMRSGIPGLDLTGSAGILNTVNSSIMRGGAGGEASQNFMYATLGRGMGLTPLQVQMLQEQGAFGTGASTFGEGSVFDRYTTKFRGNKPGEKARTDTETTLTKLMRGLRSSGYNDEQMADAMRTMFGTNLTQSQALAMIEPEQMGQLQGYLKKAGVRIEDVNEAGINKLSQINASTNLTDEQKLALISKAAKDNQESTPGSEARRTRQGIENLEQRVANDLVPLTRSMRDSILFLAGGAKKSPGQVNQEMADISIADKNAALIKERSALERQSDGGLGAGIANMPTSVRNELQRRAAANQSRINAIAEEMEKNAREIRLQYGVGTAEDKRLAGDGAGGIPAPNGGGASPGTGSTYIGGDLKNDRAVREYLAETDRRAGLPPGTAAAMIARESSFNPNAIGEDTKWGRAKGLAQILPGNIKELSMRAGKDFDPMNPMHSLEMQRMLLVEGASAEGNVRDNVQRYHAGPNRQQWGAKTSMYADKVIESAGDYAQLPGYGAGAGRGSQGGPTARELEEYRARVVLDVVDGRTNKVVAQPKFELGRAAPAGMRQLPW